MSVDRYYTPPHLARVMVGLANPRPGDHVLEPSAGDGALFAQIAPTGAWTLAFDIEASPTSGYSIRRADFLTLVPAGYPAIDFAIMNPPYKNSLDLQFVERVLEWAPVVVALLRSSVLHGKAWHRRVWSKHTLSDVIYCGRVAFSGPDAVAKKGDGAGKPCGARHDFVIVKIERGRWPYARPQPDVCTRWLYDISEAA